MEESTGLPRARRERLVLRPLRDELLVYDLDSHRVHCLNPVAAAVWRQCDGRATPAQIAARLVGDATIDMRADLREEVVALALDRLSAAGLLLGPRPPRPRLRRRELMRWLGAAALPLVASVVAPTPAEAARCSVATNRPNGCPCTSNGQCQSGNCNNCPGGFICCSGNSCNAASCR
jgi:hypothetical protein